MIFITLSVHDIVDLFLRKGHLDTRVFNMSSMLEGTKIHKMYQDSQGKDYIPEYYLSSEFNYEKYHLSISGRADGVFIKDNKYVIEEIKSTISNLEQFISDHGQWHLGQAMFYAYMLGKEKKLDSVEIQMTYINQLDKSDIKKINQIYKMEDLDVFVNGLIIDYVSFYQKIYERKMVRDKFVNEMEFPFDKYRLGQKDMINFIDKQISLTSTGYIEAPTGIGKTVSILYPAMKKLKYNDTNYILYLTNKNSIKKVAMETLSLFEKQKSKIKSIQFTSKENICPNVNKQKCNPDDCYFARYYYDKLNDAIKDALEETNLFSEDFIKNFTMKKDMCPYQFQHDLSKYCDVLICDYNYVFDINDFIAYTEIDASKSILCIDESHNLPTRVKDMYSIQIKLEYLDKIISMCMTNNLSKLRKNIDKLYKSISTIEIDQNKIKVPSIFEIDEVDIEIKNSVSAIITEIKKLLRNSPIDVSDELLEFYFYMQDFDKLLDLVLDEYKKYFNVYLVIEQNNIISFNIQNLVSREIINNKIKRFKSTIFFSATLSPKDYYIDLLGGNIENKDNILILPSPFSNDNRRVFIDSRYSLYYKDREKTLPYIYQEIKDIIKQKVGNYFIYVPSFEYLNKLKNLFKEDKNGYYIHYQNNYMSEKDRASFLSYFKGKTKKTHVGILVLGGIFSEGIDLIGDRLIGAIIISAGIPLITYNGNKEAQYYNENDSKKNGFNYAYVYPGINKIIQAAGRVIRSEEDKGFILFCDSRFNNDIYRKIFKEIYPDAINVKSNNDIINSLVKFYSKEKNEV